MTVPAPSLATPLLSLVVPCYNGERQLQGKLEELAHFLDEQSYTTQLILVDDCSRQPAADILRDFATSRSCTTLIRNDVNRGKGASVARGMLAATGTYRIFTDADLAYPPSQINRILGDLQTGADVAIACRVLKESRYIMSPSFFHYLYTRHLMSRFFNRVVRTVLIRDVVDTQAGLKGFTAAAAERIFPLLTIARFGFDVEVIFIAQRSGLSVKQTDVTFRYDDEPTTVDFAQSALTMGGDLLKIRLNHWRGRYN